MILVNGKSLSRYIHESYSASYVPGDLNTPLRPGNARTIFLSAEKNGQKYLVIYRPCSSLIEIIKYELDSYQEMDAGEARVLPWLESKGFIISNIEFRKGTFSSIIPDNTSLPVHPDWKKIDGLQVNDWQIKMPKSAKDLREWGQDLYDLEDYDAVADYLYCVDRSIANVIIGIFSAEKIVFKIKLARTQTKYPEWRIQSFKGYKGEKPKEQDRKAILMTLQSANINLKPE